MMEKPRYSRRSFLNGVWAVLGALSLAELLALVVGFFKPGKTGTEGMARDTLIVAGEVDDFEPGSVSAFIRGKFYLARLDDGGFLALSRSCTHLGCSIPWVSDEDRFICPCHSSEFDITGEVLKAPAPRALDLYPVEITGNIVSIDTGKTLRRAGFEASQVRYVENT